MPGQIHRGWIPDQQPVARNISGSHGSERELFPGEWWATSGVRLDDGAEALVYDVDARRRPVMAEPGLLTEFRKLGSAPSEQILGLASRYGVLELCRHGYPFHHDPPGVDLDFDYDDAEAFEDWLIEDEPACGCRPLSRGEEGAEVYWEPVEAWRHFGRRADAIIECNDMVTNSTMPDDNLLRLALDLDETDLLPKLIEVRRFLGGEANRWLQLGGSAQAELRWTREGSPHVSFAGPGIFAAVGLQLIAQIADGIDRKLVAGGHTATCSWCGTVYQPSRKPRQDQRNYCPGCRESNVPYRLSMRDRRSKAREGQ